MCFISVIKAGEQLSQYEVHLDGDETPYRVWDDTEEHAKAHAEAIAHTLVGIGHNAVLVQKLFNRITSIENSK